MRAVSVVVFVVLLFVVRGLGFDLLWSVFVMGAAILAGLVLLYSATLPATRAQNTAVRS